MSVKKLKGLGRGLDALFGADTDTGLDTAADVPYEEMPLENLMPGSTQPRSRMDAEALGELADSIRRQGVISPLIVRPAAEADGKFEIIAGERRFRAAAMAGLTKVPVIVRRADVREALALALIENIQREDLNPIEEALGIARLIEECGYTHEEAAEAVGRSRTSVTNLLRLLTLTDEVKSMLAEGVIEMGHARALVALTGAEQILLAKDVAARGLSVRQTEDLVRKSREEKPAKKKVVIKTRDDLRLEESLAERLGAVVRLTANRKGRGRIVIEFANLEQLQGIVDRIQLQQEL